MMNIKAQKALPKKSKNSCLLVATSLKTLSGAGKQIDKVLKGRLSELIKRGDISGTRGECITLYDATGSGFDRVIVVGFGSPSALTRNAYLRILGKAFKTAGTTKATEVISALAQVAIKAANESEDDIGDTAAAIESWKVQQQARLLLDSRYTFTGHQKSAKNAKSQRSGTDKVKAILLVDALSERQAINPIKEGLAVAKGSALARDLGNLAPNICTPSYLATVARDHARGNDKLKVTVIGEKQMEKLGMGAFLAVSRGSRQEGKLIVMEYNGASKTTKPTVLLGKGITFDTGGISIKPSATMDEMKYDMCGAASVFGAMAACLEVKPKKNILFVVAAAENMPDGDAARPGDVVETLSGKTVEILNTDAEGRLVLCDSLTYIEKYKPKAVVDVATLTGACVVALGGVATGLMSNDRKLTDQLLEASRTSGDKAWELPLWDEYRPQLDSNFADLANIGGRTAGAITAGVFLKQFADKYPWAHLDIAGTAWKGGGTAKGATGRPVPLLMQYLLTN